MRKFALVSAFVFPHMDFTTAIAILSVLTQTLLAIPVHQHLDAREPSKRWAEQNITIERFDNMDRILNAPEGLLPVYAEYYHSCPVHFSNQMESNPFSTIQLPTSCSN